MDRLDGVEGFLSLASGASSRRRRDVPFDGVEPSLSMASYRAVRRRRTTEHRPACLSESRRGG